MKMRQESTSNPNLRALEPYGFFYTSDGMRIRCGRWRASSVPCRGSVLILTGRAEFMEKYQETIQELNGRGFDVFSFDWRGQGLSGRMLDDPQKGYVDSYEQYLADLDHILQALFYPEARKPLMILAHSMGAHIALRFLDRPAAGFDKAVLLAPMIDIATEPAPRKFSCWLSRFMVQQGFGSVNILGSNHYNPFRKSFARNRFTSDAVRFSRTMEHIRQNPQLAVGSVTYRWLAATFDSIDLLQGAEFGSGLQIPILLVLAGNDQVVSNRAIERLSKKLPMHLIKRIKTARHEILQENDMLRTEFWRAFDEFVQV